MVDLIYYMVILLINDYDILFIINILFIMYRMSYLICIYINFILLYS